ncbi:hypothetical protein HDU96_007610 [Phlyctochytrium bullatum]|nr:hypothetical protein HDU96_007610 [Phlyctochytrium bullatum]
MRTSNVLVESVARMGGLLRRPPPPVLLGRIGIASATLALRSSPPQRTCSRCKSSLASKPTANTPTPLLRFDDPSNDVDAPPPRSNPTPDSRLRLGHAVLTLQDDIPNFFHSGLSDTSIYHPSLVFRDPCHESLSHIVVRGRPTYLSLANLLRWTVRLYYETVDVEIIRMVQFRGPYGNDNDGGGASNGATHFVSSTECPSHGQPPTNQPLTKFSLDNDPHPAPPDDDTSTRLMVRWVFEAVPRHQALLSYINPLHLKPSVFEGVFIYRFDEEGYIVEHVLQSVYPCPPLLAACRWWFKTKASTRATGGGAEVPTLHP